VKTEQNKTNKKGETKNKEAEIQIDLNLFRKRATRKTVGSICTNSLNGK
jgi:hypothetical protein